MKKSNDFVAKVLLSGISPLLIAIALLLGGMALILTPREEDPQIVVPMANVLISAPGLTPRQIENQITEPAEQLLSQIDGVEHVYSQSMDGQALIIVRFFVGENREDSLVKLYTTLESNQDSLPTTVKTWLVKPIDIDHVPIVVAALYSKEPNKTDSFQLRRLAEEMTQRLKAIDNTHRVKVTGGLPREIQIELDPSSLAGHHTSVEDIRQAIFFSNQHQHVGMIRKNDQTLFLKSGEFYQSASELEKVVINVVNGKPVYLQDVATVTDGPALANHYTFFSHGLASDQFIEKEKSFPSVFLSIAKQKGSNAVWVAQDVIEKLDEIKKDWLPKHVGIEIIRNYGYTANEKVSNLVGSLAFAVLSVVLFVGFLLNWRSALVVALAIPISYGATLICDLIFGYSINRVTLFALILALGLIVDDPIASIDNIDRYLKLKGLKKVTAISLAMAEIRSALLMSTVAIVIVFMPMLFITGMMGPYMAPMAFNVPIAVIFSTVTAFCITPWLAYKILKTSQNTGNYSIETSSIYIFYRKILSPILLSKNRQIIFLILIALLFLVASLLPVFRLIPLKLLPYDNKNEFQLVMDMPEGTSVERSLALNEELSDYLRAKKEVVSVSSFVGISSPMDFNGMVRHYFLRSMPNQAELRVVLIDKNLRSEQSSELITAWRNDLQALAEKYDADLQLVEVPPGPPVISTLVAEVYGDSFTPYQDLEKAALKLSQRLEKEPMVREVYASVPNKHEQWQFIIDKEKAALSGIAVQDINNILNTANFGSVLGELQLANEVQPLRIVAQLPRDKRDNFEDLLSLYVQGKPGNSIELSGNGRTNAALPMVQLSELGYFKKITSPNLIFHKNLKPVSYVFAHSVGRTPAEIIADIHADRDKDTSEFVPLDERSYVNNGGGIGWSLPDNIKVVWDGEGEWQITVRVFIDLGLAFGVALIGVYLVLRMQTKMTGVSSIIMLSIPLTIIGIMPGFWFLNMLTTEVNGYPMPVLFTATAMIGMIALAGIVVRNALVLIEFIQQATKEGLPLDEALYQSGAVRMRPILLTAGTTLFGNLVITLDPIFSGLAWSIIFGIIASTVFTLLVVPVVYYMLYKDQLLIESQIRSRRTKGEFA